MSAEVIWDPVEPPAWAGTIELSDGYGRYVERFGEGEETLVCLHGGPGAKLDFFYPLTKLARDGVQVVMYDQLGGGRSSRPDHDDLFTLEHFVREFEELVAAMDLGRVHLLGQSWGGMLTLQCAIDCPQLLKTLFICDTAASVRRAAEGYEEVLEAVPAELRDEVLETQELDADTPASRALLELYASRVRRAFPFDLERSCQEFLAHVVPKLEDLGRPYQVMWGPNEFTPTGPLLEWDVSDRLAEIETPAIAICGAHDEVVPSCTQEIAEGIPGAQCLILGQSSHMIFHEADAEVAMGAIDAFMRSHA
ncbi:MAG TPA: proline iminopeptidase-family hydrolase [Solirubrobacterales bacterium]|nr:proline iminopeptidase-family hydrolase [Solirubrobacterales bacterium]